MKNNILITGIIIVIVAAGAFFGGMKYQQSRRGSFGQFGRGQGIFSGRNAGNGRPVVGQIVGQDANSITVKLQDGSTRIVNISDTTTFSKTDKATKTDIKNGQEIAVFGTDNSDGSLTAQNVQLNPMFRFGRTGVQQTAQ